MHAGSVSKSYLVIDIETILDPELPIEESSDVERLPAPPHHKVIVVGALWLDEVHQPRKLGVIGETKEEPEILSDFAKFMEERRPTIVTWNGRSFDMPVIAARCLRHGVALRHYYSNKDVRYRFSPEGHLDLMDYLADFGAAKPAKLDIMAKLIGMPGKVGLAGKDVGPFVHAGKIQEVRDYCLCDVIQTAAVFLRVELLRGELERTTYLQAMTGLISMLQNDPRVAAIATGIDENRLLLRDSGTDP